MLRTVLLCSFLFILNLSKSQNVNNLLTYEKFNKPVFINLGKDTSSVGAELPNFYTAGAIINSSRLESDNTGIITYSEGKAKMNTGIKSFISNGSERNTGAFYTISGEKSLNIGVVNQMKGGISNIGVINSMMENYNNREGNNIGIYNKILNNGNGQKSVYNFGVLTTLAGTNNTNIAYSGIINTLTNDEKVKVYTEHSNNYVVKGEINAEESINYGLHLKVEGKTSENTGIHVEVGLGRSNKAAHLKGDVMFESIFSPAYYLWNHRTGSIVSGWNQMPKEEELGLSSLSIGLNSFSKANYSATIGEGLKTHQDGQLSVGKYNALFDDTSAIRNGSLIQVGNGQIFKPGNAFEVTFDSKIFQDWIGINHPEEMDSYGEIDSSLSSILKLEARQYVWKNSYGHPGIPQFGFDPVSFKKVFPDLMTRNSEGEKTLNMVALIPVLTEAIKEMNAKNQEQEKLLTTAFEKIELLQKSLKELSSKLEKKEEDTDSDKDGLE